MISKLSISNFQSHKRTVINFTEGLNVISGTSDSGKSSIIRALLWVILNRPSGDSIRNWYAGDEDVSVSIELENDTITKIRKSNKNIYIVNGKTLEAFRSDVPEEVSEVFRITDFNLQQQHQPYFLLNDSPGDRAKKLNELVGLDIIDRMFKNINSEITESKRELDKQTITIGRLTVQIDSLSYIDELAKDLEDLNKLSEEVEEKEYDVNILRTICSEICSIDSEIEKFSTLFSVEPLLIDINNKISEYVSKVQKFELITVLSDQLEEVDTNLRNEIKWLGVENYYSDIIGEIDSQEILKKKISDILYITDKIASIDSSIKTEESNIKTAKTKLEQVLKKNKVCPVCYQAITDDVVERILE